LGDSQKGTTEHGRPTFLRTGNMGKCTTTEVVGLPGGEVSLGGTTKLK
jgi:hypothetical protein